MFSVDKAVPQGLTLLTAKDYPEECYQGVPPNPLLSGQLLVHRTDRSLDSNCFEESNIFNLHRVHTMSINWLWCKEALKVKQCNELTSDLKFNCSSSSAYIPVTDLPTSKER